MNGFKKYGKPLLGFFISIGIVFGSMNIWMLTIISPLLVFLVFKLLKIWKTKERAIYGVPAIVIGVILFFLVFSYQSISIPEGHFENGNLKAVIQPYSTPYINKSFEISATYNGITHKNLTYLVKDMDTNSIVDSSTVSGIIKNNVTEYHFKLQLDKGIYNITLSLGNETLFMSAIKEEPMVLFEKYVMHAGWYVSLLLSVLYLLFIFGVHMIRRGQKMGVRYAPKK